jgi:hypothetical protein
LVCWETGKKRKEPGQPRRKKKKEDFREGAKGAAFFFKTFLPGNAMGYVRMIRSGSMLYTSNAIQFVPDVSAIEKFEDKVVADGLSAESVAAAQCVFYPLF